MSDLPGINICLAFKLTLNENRVIFVVILYDSLTGNVGRFVKKLPLEATPIRSDMVVDQGFVLITFTTGLGKVSDTTKAFLEVNHHYLKGIAASGNKNFGIYFAVAADEISRLYHVPIISKFELSGTPTDVKLFMEGLSEIEAY